MSNPRQFDSLFSGTRGFINPFRDIFTEEFDKTGGVPPTPGSIMEYEDFGNMQYEDGTQMLYEG